MNVRAKTISDGLIKKFEQKPLEVAKLVKRGMIQTSTKTEELVINSIKDKDLRVSGRLLQSVRSYWKNPFIRVVEVGAKYATVLEFGGRPRTVPIRDLKLWARRKFGNENIAYPVQRAIKRRGTKPKYYIKDIKNDIIREKNKIWYNIFKKILE